MSKFTRTWAFAQMQGLHREMVGIEPTLPYRAEGQEPPDEAIRGDLDPDIDYAEQWMPTTDLRAARLISMRLEERLTFVGEKDKGYWYYWNGVYHEQVKSGVVGDWITEAFADEYVLAMNAAEEKRDDLIANAIDNAAAKAIRDSFTTRFKPHRGMQDRLHNESGLNQICSRLRKHVTKEPDFFENDRRWLVCKNGVIDLEHFRKSRKIQLLAHSSLRPVYRSVECSYNRESYSKAPNWYHFLETSLPDPELRAFIQRLVGAAILAEPKVKALPNLCGPKDCGKTVLIMTLDKVLGGYGAQPSPDGLMKQQGVNFEQDKFRGKRFIAVSEPDVTDTLDETFVKKVTGGDVVNTRTLYAATTDWIPQGVIFIASNEPVNFRISDKALQERLCFIQFPHQFFDAKDAAEDEIHIKDPELEKKFEDEYEGILMWALIGAANYLEYGIDKPAAVIKTGEQYQTESSSALTWIEEKIGENLLKIDRQASDRPMYEYVLLNRLYQAYTVDMTRDGETKYLGKHAFSKHVQARYGPVHDSNGRRLPRIVGIGEWATLCLKAEY